MGLPIDRELERLARAWRWFWPGGDAAAMAADAGERARAAVGAWKLENVEVLGGGEVALVCAGVRAGRAVVLKVQPRGHPEERAMAGEAAALAAWAGSGVAVPLLGVRDAELTLLLERLSPGTPLDATAPGGAERLRILGGVAARLHAAAPADPVGVVGLDEYCAPWRRDLAERPTDLAELDDLLATTTEETVLHGDLHGGNVLRHRDRWLAIDPHAARGDPSAEIWSLIDPLSPVPDAAPQEIRAAVSAFAAVAGLDPVRAARWARIRALAEAAAIDRNGRFDAEERGWAARLRRFAGALDPA